MRMTDRHLADGSHIAPWNIAGYIFVVAGVVLLVYVGATRALSRYRTWHESKPVQGLTSAQFAAVLADPENARLLRVATPLDPYAVEIDAEKVVVRLAGIDAPAPSGPWTAEADDDRVRSATRERLADAAEAAEHRFIAVGTQGTAVVFIDPAHCPGSISIGGDQEAAIRLADLLTRQSDAAGHGVDFVFGPAEGAQWRWTLAADGELDTDVLGVQVQTVHLAKALEARNAIAARNARNAIGAVNTNAAKDTAEAVKHAEQAEQTAAETTESSKPSPGLLDRLDVPVRGSTAESTPTSARTLLLAGTAPHHDPDAVSAADSAAPANVADLE